MKVQKFLLGCAVAMSLAAANLALPVNAQTDTSAATATAETKTSKKAAKQAPDVNVESDQMEFIDAEKKAVFTGNVDAQRGDVNLKSDVMTVFYKASDAKAPPASDAQAGTGAAATAAQPAETASAESGSAGASGTATDPASGSSSSSDTATKRKTEVTTIDAKGNVVITTPRERITGEWAKIDVAKNLLTVGGDLVVLTQGTNVLKGKQLQVDLKTNQTTMTGGRVKGNFVPQ
ncbi:MAG: LptA/OstA family protein [Hyphomicrobiales bacterium]